MNLERRDSARESPPETERPLDPRPEGKKPVIVYILILFVVAFLLMALSFLMHQRSNSEVLGELRHSVSAMQELQTSQEIISRLERELEESRAAAADFEDACETARNQAAHAEYLLEQTREATDRFSQLNEAYAQEDMERCREILQAMEGDSENPLSGYLPKGSAASRFQEIRAAVEAADSTAH